MLGFKIAITGIVVATVSIIIISAIGRPMPHPAIAYPLLTSFTVGVMAIVCGILVEIWL